ncbi:UDP-2,3-diacylglucosamine diphosphatase [Shewanella yunxiaonensis]|uniref:UDP-2,3-diacylglucosamine diphosphatase n=1 Tax=Shewanella yunxiaonensis TaxID=2829809 RepID=A0ABX7YRQ0_9GAMM|nr:UDP-2,3-diacylglucosamine diphosphatase [Shewanella yunxiaonensis]QUN05463.1 UDP-2,3-diacylglucosamine diphosphatase [Shewanella yunxiaonensis]
MTSAATSTSRYCRAIWLSDLHLGEKHCRAEYLLTFLKQHQSDFLFLVGDVVDMQALNRRWYWPNTHQQVFQLLVDKARQGTRVIYVPGNHDVTMRRFDGGAVDQIEVHREFIYDSPSHGKLLLIHGDEFDRELCASRFDAWLGDNAYDLVLFLNRLWNAGRRLLGLPYQSVARTLKQCSTKAETAMQRFREAALQSAFAHGVNGVVCGHIHHPELQYREGRLYINTGDWVENCTAVLEHRDGRLELCHYSEVEKPLSRLVPQEPAVTG